MTFPPHPSFSLTATVDAGTGTAHLRITGDLDYETGDELVHRATQFLDAHPDLHALRLDCAHLRFCDSSGLSALLMIHRTTAAGNVVLHLDDPPPFLERILTTTGVRGLFPPAPASRRAGQSPPASAD